MIDPFTARRHRDPDYSIRIEATGVKLPDGMVSWNIKVTQGYTSKWWAKVLNDWAKLFLERGLQSKK